MLPPEIATLMAECAGNYRDYINICTAYGLNAKRSFIYLNYYREFSVPRTMTWGDQPVRWTFKGNIHRIGAPAAIWSSCTRQWQINGLIHRLDPKGTAEHDKPSTFWDGGKRWLVYGIEHRVNGPSTVAYDDDNKFFSLYQQNDILNRENDLPAHDGDNMQIWYLDGKIHRDFDQPAVIYANGSQEWFQNGKLHRDFDQPAIILADGTQMWYRHGKQHRDFGLPAVVYLIPSENAGYTDFQEWWLDGIRYFPYD